MRIRILVVLFFLLLVLGVLGFAPIHFEHAINDKLLHFIAFFLLAVCFYFMWDLSFKRNLILAGILMASVAILSECIQGLLSYRTFDGYDILANMVGGVSGLLIAFGLDYAFASWRERQRRWGGKREAEYQRALMDETDLNEEGDDYDLDEEQRYLTR